MGSEQQTSAEYRALLTAREREILSGEADVDASYRYRVVSRVRDKIERLGDDLALLDRAHDSLGDELRDVVCSADSRNDIAVEGSSTATVDDDEVEAGEQASTDDESEQETPSAAFTTNAAADTSAPVDARDDGVSEDVRRAVDAIAERENWTDPDDKLAQRKAAARAVLTYAVELGEDDGAVSKSDAVDRFLPKYAVRGRSEYSWWDELKRDVLSSLGEHESGIGYRVSDDDVRAFLNEQNARDGK